MTEEISALLNPIGGSNRKKENEIKSKTCQMKVALSREDLIDQINRGEFANRDITVNYEMYSHKNVSTGKVQNIEQIEEIKTLLLSEFRFVNISGMSLYIYRDGYFKLLYKKNFGAIINSIFLDMGRKLLMKKKEYDELLAQLYMEPGIYIDQDDCYSDMNKIVFENGTFNVLTGSMEPHQEADYQFAKIHADLNLEAEEPVHDISRDYIRSICNYDENQELYFWELVGYLLSSYRRKVIVVFYGPGDTGKSTLANFIRKLCGTESCAAMSIKELSSKFGMSALQGMRLCIDSEMDAASLNATDVRNMKRICGDDLIMAEKKYEDHFNFVPTAKLLLCTNNKISVSSSEDIEPFLRRLQFFELRNSIPKENQRADLLEFLEEDRDYFLCQAMKGLMRLVDNNFCFSCSILSSEYVNYTSGVTCFEDIALFVNTYCELGEEYETKVGELYQAYLMCIRKEGYTSISKKGFSENLVKMYGLERHRTKVDRYIVGIRLL